MTTQRANINAQDSALRHQLAEAILERAKERGLKDTEAAQRLGIVKQSYSVLKTGADKISLSKLVEYADRIGLEVELSITPRNITA
ncbi:XRE family transcriptional regulator [Nocardia vinacea]|uniref:XRE family transcriptional regulator n=1 Tax=Nocardia vinacea TaxID=96468 RepID=UPI0033C343B4